MTLAATNSTASEHAVMGAVEQAFAKIPVPIDTLWDADACPAALLPWLAWTLSVDEWNPDWSEEVRRAVIAASAEVHRHKGTLGAIKRALVSAGYGDSSVIEGMSAIRYDGSASHDGSETYGTQEHWATYEVIMERPLSYAQGDFVRGMLEGVAPARCQLRALDFTQVANIYNGAITYDGAHSHGVV